LTQRIAARAERRAVIRGDIGREPARQHGTEPITRMVEALTSQHVGLQAQVVGRFVHGGGEHHGGDDRHDQQAEYYAGHRSEARSPGHRRRIVTVELL
jgi:hypothetical protein